MKKIIALMGFVLLFAGCSRNYSDGFRIGEVRKFSRKGVFIKSWEGELLLGGVVSTHGDNPRLVNEIWKFSVDPDAAHGENIQEIVDQIAKAAESGKRTKVYYNQDTFPKIRTLTDYFVKKVEILD